VARLSQTPGLSQATKHTYTVRNGNGPDHGLDQASKHIQTHPKGATTAVRAANLLSSYIAAAK
jgi:hypothetical protein